MNVDIMATFGSAWESMSSLLHTTMNAGTTLTALLGLYLAYIVGKVGYNVTKTVATTGVNMVKSGFKGVGVVGSSAKYLTRPAPMASLFLSIAIASATTAGLGIGDIVQETAIHPTLGAPLTNKELINAISALKEADKGAGQETLKQVLDYAAIRDQAALTAVAADSRSHESKIPIGFAMLIGGAVSTVLSAFAVVNRCEAMKKSHC